MNLLGYNFISSVSKTALIAGFTNSSIFKNHWSDNLGSITALVLSEVPTLFMWISVFTKAPIDANSFEISSLTTNLSFPW